MAEITRNQNQTFFHVEHKDRNNLRKYLKNWNLTKNMTLVETDKHLVVRRRLSNYDLALIIKKVPELNECRVDYRPGIIKGVKGCLVTGHKLEFE